MILKALMAWAGIRAAYPSSEPASARAQAPCVERPHNDEAHAATNREQAIFSGAQLVAHRSLKLSQAMTSDPSNTTRISRGIDDMRTLMAEVARRAER